MDWNIVVGASKGMGHAFVTKLASENQRVLAVARTASLVFTETTENIVPLDIDLNDSSSYSKIKEFIGDAKVNSLFYFAVLEGPMGMENTNYEEFENVMRVNSASKLFITKDLAGNLREGAKVVFLYSKAAQKYMLNAPIYCISRAAEYMVYKVLKEELKNCYFTVVYPGIVKTEMYYSVLDKFPPLRDLPEHSLLEPSTVADFLYYLYSDAISGEHLHSREWGIYDSVHHQFWLKQGTATPIAPDF